MSSQSQNSIPPCKRTVLRKTAFICNGLKVICSGVYEQRKPLVLEKPYY